MMTNNTELENVKAENRDLISDNKVLQDKVALAQKNTRALKVENRDLKRQLRDANTLLKWAKNPY